MSESAKGVHIARLEQGSVRVSVPKGTSLDKIFKSKALVEGIRGPVRAGGCQACISGKDLRLEQFEEVILVELAE